ncbi:MAG: PSD1 and planctomycete cytochrome C domain-containing protein [Verrucomicrobiales bacterium]|nr:PSD1 and planctomycete cytochrome C domain-containing protein [Verrucomicrobiales bacterium]
MKPLSLFFSISLFPVLLSTAQEIPADHLDFFEKNIRPALIKHCYKCHSEEGDKIKGGLLLDTRESSRQGGDSGPAIVPHSLTESLLFTAISYEDDSLEMPPKYKLPESVINDFKKWIEMGAPDPRIKAAKPTGLSTYTNTIDVEKGRAEHWAWQKPEMPDVPETTGWGNSKIDSFIAAGLAEKELTPSPAADGATLIRRISFDLLGLPPSLKMVKEFTTAYSTDPDGALEKVIDTLLATPQYGERWGRHWLDVARYAESSGKETNASFPFAWRYRDWVIDAFNEDKPFNEMITEQIAGDLLEEKPGEKTIATGFLAIGVKGLNERNVRQFRFDVADEQIDTTTRAFLATTASCARCHDHKFDPVPMSDYYSLAGIFLSSNTHIGTPEGIQNRHSNELITLPASFHGGGRDLPLPEAIDQEFQLALLKDQAAEIQTNIRDARQSGNNDEANRLRLGLLGVNSRIGIQTAKLVNYSDSGKLLPKAMGLSDRSEPFDSQILIRGEEDNATTERAPRGFLQVVKSGDEQMISTDQSGRLQLAAWISSPNNPLTARVYVNRVWMWLFGEGLVSTVDNFGTTGEKPVNQDLLDYLALRFIELDWSTKALIKEIMLTQTYRMNSEFREEHFEKDPNNRLHWRANKRRLDAESIRDSILAVSGQIDLQRPDGSIVSHLGPGFIGRTVSEVQLNKEVNYRSVYLPIVRDLVPDALNLFDFADPSLMAGKREITTVPSQALYLMNSDFVQSGSEQMASFLRDDLKLRGEKLGLTAYFLAYSRPPTPGEIEKTKAYFATFIEAAMNEGKTRTEALNLSLTTFCQALISSAEFRYIN